MKKLILWCLVLAVSALFAPAFAEASDYTFKADSGMLSHYVGPGGAVTVPAGIDGTPVFGIDVQTFNRNDDITALEIPEPVAMLDISAVAGMAALTRVTLPDTLEYIGMSNFTDCGSLTEVTIPPRVLFIGQDCFVWTDALQSVTFTGPTPYISKGAFRYLPDGFAFYVPDDQLEAYASVLPEGTDIRPSGENAVVIETVTPESEFEFDPETGTLTGWSGTAPRVAIPAEIGGVAVKAIGPQAFRDRDCLFKAIIPEGVEVIGEQAFDGCDNLVAVDCPDSVREIGANAFAYKYRGEQFPWPAGLQTIGDRAFIATRLSGDLVLPEGLETIGAEAFMNAWIKNVYLPASLKSIGSGAFARASISTITFGGTDLDIGEDAFSGFKPKSVVLPWDTDEATLEAFRQRFTALNEECAVELAERPAAAISDEDIERFGGLWYLNTISQDGMEMSAADAGMEITIQLNEDGTSTMTMDEAAEGLWTVDGDTVIISVEGTDDVAFTGADGTLTASDAGMTLVFGREPARPGYIPGAPTEAEGPDAFNGTWECRYASIYGMTMPVEMFGDSLADLLGMESLTFEIRGSDVRMLGAEAAKAFDFSDGILSTQDSPACALTLLDDGMMACAINEGTLYFERTSEDSTLPELTPEPTPEPTATPEPTPEPTATPEPTPEPTATPEPTPEPAPIGEAFPATNARYVCTGASVNGHNVDVSALGGAYEAIFRANGTADITLAGTSLDSVDWECESDAVFVDYLNGGHLRFDRDGDGLALTLSDTLYLSFTAVP